MTQFKFSRRAVALAAAFAILPGVALAQVKEPVRVGHLSSKSGVFAQ